MSRKDWRRPLNFDVSPDKKRIGLELSYNGALFSGWQMQKGERTVQEEIVKAVIRLTKCTDIAVCGSGRTDSGVHAASQCAHIELPKDCAIPVNAFIGGLNSFLPKDIRIINAWFADPGFHARFSAMAREYRYFLTEEREKTPFSKKLITYIERFPDINRLNEYASLIVGTHDFTTFSSVKDLSESKFRDIYQSEFSFTTSVFGEKILVYRICGNAFLYHMVRSLVGSMLQAAKENQTAEDFRKRLDAADRSLCGKTAPPEGLYLWRVSYNKDEFEWFEEKYGR